MTRRPIAVVAVALMLASCTPSGEGSDGPGPVRGGKVVIGFFGAPATLDPYAPLASELTWALSRPLYPSLFRLTPEGAAEPYLAERTRRDGDRIRIDLHEARWSDGSTVTASDVVASARRAPAGVGLGRFDEVDAVDRDTVVLAGAGETWAKDLATLALVLPKGRAGRVSGGPLRIARVERGLEIVYRRNDDWFAGETLLDEVVVRFVAGLDIQLGLMGDGSLDVAAVPGSINLDDRLKDLGLEFDEARGDELVALELARGSLSPGATASVAGLVDTELLHQGLFRDDGSMLDRAEDQAAPGPVPDPLVLSAPEGDELLGAIERILFEEADERGVVVELVDAEPEVFYGRWRDGGPAHVRIVRSTLPHSGSALDLLPLARVDTMVAWRPGVAGVRANPTAEGPLWNVEEWFILPPPGDGAL